jgi:hypothetical protein
MNLLIKKLKELSLIKKLMRLRTKKINKNKNNKAMSRNLKRIQ